MSSGPGSVVERPAAALRAALRCPLCKDTLRMAYTAPQCMHSFCRACIEPLMADEDEMCPCPVCNRKLGLQPFSSGELRFDRSLTALSLRLFPRADDAERMAQEEQRAAPSLQRAEAPRHKEAPADRKPRGRPVQATVLAAPVAHANMPSCDKATVAFALINNAAEGSATLDLARPFLRASACLTAAQLAHHVASAAGCEAASVQPLLPDGQVAGADSLLAALLRAASPLPVVAFAVVR